MNSSSAGNIPLSVSLSPMRRGLPPGDPGGGGGTCRRCELWGVTDTTVPRHPRSPSKARPFIQLPFK
ncbi:protein of unknown function [Azospirillum baldaniorum]|uniref:Uncharacterized protein n=1 Tax=Azospirillum baldaniorum TaxID=1064539 RepID=A0A9P1JST9_9PROT|nr:protein of unknown function [Azospirillum baldaniorum]